MLAVFKFWESHKFFWDKLEVWYRKSVSKITDGLFLHVSWFALVEIGAQAAHHVRHGVPNILKIGELQAEECSI